MGRHMERDWLNHPKRWVDHLPFEGVIYPQWMRDAACAGTDPEAFFRQHQGDPQAVAAALRVCASCPVRVKCLEYALSIQTGAASSLPGIWGGTSEKHRQRLLRKRAQQRD